MDEIINLLTINNFISKKISKHRLYVFTNDNRIEILNKLCNMLNGKIYKDLCGVSSIGYIFKDNVKIFVKPKEKQGENSNGIENEMKLFEFLTNEIKYKNI